MNQLELLTQNYVKSSLLVSVIISTLTNLTTLKTSSKLSPTLWSFDNLANMRVGFSKLLPLVGPLMWLTFFAVTTFSENSLKDEPVDVSVSPQTLSFTLHLLTS